MARPKKENELTHQNIITVRLTDVELELVNKKADTANISRSEYIRKCLLGGKLTVTHEIVAEFPDIREEMKKTNLLLSNIANNINQIAKHFNTGGLRSQAVTAELEKALDAVLQIHFDVARMVDKVHRKCRVKHKDRK